MKKRKSKKRKKKTIQMLVNATGLSTVCVKEMLGMSKHVKNSTALTRKQYDLVISKSQEKPGEGPKKGTPSAPPTIKPPESKEGEVVVEKTEQNDFLLSGEVISEVEDRLKTQRTKKWDHNAYRIRQLAYALELRYDDEKIRPIADRIVGFVSGMGADEKTHILRDPEKREKLPPREGPEALTDEMYDDLKECGDTYLSVILPELKGDRLRRVSFYVIEKWEESEEELRKMLEEYISENGDLILNVFDLPEIPVPRKEVELEELPEWLRVYEEEEMIPDGDDTELDEESPTVEPQPSTHIFRSGDVVSYVASDRNTYEGIIVGGEDGAQGQVYLVSVNGAPAVRVPARMLTSVSPLPDFEIQEVVEVSEPEEGQSDQLRDGKVNPWTVVSVIAILIILCSCLSGIGLVVIALNS